MKVDLRHFLLIATVLCLSSARAQVSTGAYPFGTFDNRGLDTINVGNLNLHLDIPVFQKAGRGLPFAYDLIYDTSIWSPATVGGTKTWQPAINWGWLAQTVVRTGYISYSTHTYVCDWPPPQHGNYYIYDTWVYHDSFGVSHPFDGSLEWDPTGCDVSLSSFTSETSDGSGLTLNAIRTTGPPTNLQKVTMPSGQVVLAPVGNAAVGSTITDTNGNQISVSSSGVYTDTTGKIAMSVSGQAPNPVTLTYPTSATGTTATYTVRYTTNTVQTNFGCNGANGSSVVNEYVGSSVSLVSEIDLPDTSKYTFTYEQTPGHPGSITGRLLSMSLPTGGIITYTYTGGNNGIECADGTTAGITRVLSNDPAGSSIAYSRTLGAGSHTDVSDGLGNHTAYDFVQVGSGTTAGQFYETSRQIYQGAVSGTSIVSRQTCYNGAVQPCTTSAFVRPITQIDTYETLDGLQQHGSKVKYNSFGLQTEQDIFDFGGPGARGSLLNKEVWVYPSSGIINLPISDTITDAGTATISQTSYGYDETTGSGHAAVVATSGLPQHGGTVGSQRGNLTTVSQWNNLGSALVTTAAYEDAGNPLTATTPNGTSTFAYEGATHAFVITSTPPTPSSGIPLPSSSTNDVASGLPLTVTDPNLQVVTFKSYDSLLRSTEVDFPDGGKTTVGFPTPALQQISVHRYQNASAVSDTESHVDVYSRIDRVALNNGQSSNPWYQQDVCYDANGNLSFRSYQYQGNGFAQAKVCSGAGDAYSYDALGRVTHITHADGTAVGYSYAGRATKMVDENGVTRISQIDGLGRPTATCEISSSTLQGVTPINCGLDISGSGFLTSYSYDLANHKTTVAQGSQTRVFQTDSLGRTVSVVEPESGTTTYSYAYNPTGLMVTRHRPKANQTNPSVPTTTTTQYDSLGRMLSVNYDDGLTPSRGVAYDTNPYWPQASPTNMKGRPVVTGTGSGATWTGGLYSYDSMGRIINLWSCGPSTCGTAGQASHTLAFSYDWTGNLISQSDGAAGQIVYGRSVAGEVTSVTNQTYKGTGNPAGLVSNMVNGPNGPVSYKLGNGLFTVNAYDSLGRNSEGWACNNGSSQNFCGDPVHATGQAYGFAIGISGARVTSVCDTVLNKCESMGYDEFNRLNSLTAGGVQNYTWTYDRYGNRWGQNALQGGSNFSASFDAATNRINTLGYVYDAAGNMTNDGSHSYTYDAEGNVLSVDSGSTAQYLYDTFNNRVRVQTSTSTYEYLYDYAGKRVSSWLQPSNSGTEGRIYLDGKQIAYRSSDGTTYFEHQDYLGTERMRTDYTGAVGSSFVSLPFGDGYAGTVIKPAGDQDSLHFAGLDQDVNSSNAPIAEHAQFREYSFMQGRWLSPDPYEGSYDISNPQSLNRYAYVLNNPLAYIDPWGLDYGVDCGPSCVGVVGSVGGLTGGGSGGNRLSPNLPFRLENGGGGGAPSKGPRSGYESLFCLGDALKSNGLSLALDAVGLIPEAEGFIKVFENTAGYQIARAVGNNAGYRGVVATQYGMKAVAQGKGAVNAVSGALGLGDTSVKGRISTGATLAGFIPGLGTYAAGVSIGVDLSKTYDAQSACVDNGKYD